jgi:hypothetical protein
VIYECEAWSLTLWEKYRAKGIRKQDPDMKIWIQKGCEWGMDKASK